MNREFHFSEENTTTYLNASRLKFLNILQSGCSNKRNAIEQWWFSKGDMSLYLEENKWRKGEEKEKF